MLDCRDCPVGSQSLETRRPAPPRFRPGKLGGAEGAAKSEFVEGEGWVATSDDAMVQQLFEGNFAPVSIWRIFHS